MFRPFVIEFPSTQKVIGTFYAFLVRCGPIIRFTAGRKCDDKEDAFFKKQETCCEQFWAPTSHVLERHLQGVQLCAPSTPLLVLCTQLFLRQFFNS